MKPDGYPLPWNDVLDCPYWSINLWLCQSREGWRDWQAGKPMSYVIPEIDNLIAAQSLPENNS